MPDRPDINITFGGGGSTGGSSSGSGSSTSSGSSSTGGSSSSSSSSSGSSGPTAAEKKQAIDSAVAGYLATVTGWGIKPSPALKKLAQRAAEMGMSSAWFVQQVRRTKDYAKRFPGIMTKNGVMRLSEAQYISGYMSARDFAGSLGRNISKEAYGAALASGNSPSEIKAKLTVNDKLRSYGPQLAEFNDYLVSTGQIKKPLERRELQDFLMGYRGDLQQAWNTAHAAFQLQEMAGVDVGKPSKGNDLGFKELQGQLKRYEALGGDPDAIDYTKIGSLISEVIPKNELYGAGIRKKDIVDMMLNGKNAPDIMKRTQQVLDTYTAAVSEPVAHAPQQYAGRQDLGGNKRPASE